MTHRPKQYEGISHVDAMKLDALLGRDACLVVAAARVEGVMRGLVDCDVREMDSEGLERYQEIMASEHSVLSAAFSAYVESFETPTNSGEGE